MLNSFYSTFAPSAIVACWDEDWRPQWRVDLLPSYKTHRVLDTTADGVFLEDEPDTLSPQIDALADLFDASSVSRIGVADYEADDVAATLAANIEGPVIVISGDRDLVQVVNDQGQVQLFLAVNGGMPKWPLLNEQGVLERYGVRPDAYVDFAILRGDPSDGIPGVPGIGEKTAAALITSFGNLEGVITAASNNPGKPMTPRLAGLIQEHAAVLNSSLIAATAVRDIPINAEEILHTKNRDAQQLNTLAQEWGVERFIPEWF